MCEPSLGYIRNLGNNIHSTYSTTLKVDNVDEGIFNIYKVFGLPNSFEYDIDDDNDNQHGQKLTKIYFDRNVLCNQGRNIACNDNENKNKDLHVTVILTNMVNETGLVRTNSENESTNRHAGSDRLHNFLFVIKLEKGFRKLKISSPRSKYGKKVIFSFGERFLRSK